MSEQQRLFFALWPDAPLRQQLYEAGKTFNHCPGRPVIASNLHLTLAFPGNVSADVRQCLEAGAEQIRLPAFRFTLDQYGFWPKPRVIWYGVTRVPSELYALVEALQSVMRDCGLKPDPRSYRPHVTLRRKASSLPQLVARDIQWHADSFVLVLSESTPEGVAYRVLGQWPLQQAKF